MRDNGVGQNLDDDLLERVVAFGKTVEEEIKIVQSEILHVVSSVLQVGRSI